MRCQPGVPGTCRAPKALQPVAKALDIVAFDDQLAALNTGAANRAAAAILKQRLRSQSVIRARKQGAEVI